MVPLIGVAAACGLDGSSGSPTGGVMPHSRGADAGDDAAREADSGDASDLFGDDAPINWTPDAADGAVRCFASGGGGGSGSSCDITDSWTCSDGTYPQAHCTCPAGTCDCSSGSDTRKGVPFHGCPMCPSTDQAAAICGIPQ
jgi:hypothetical protein